MSVKRARSPSSSSSSLSCEAAATAKRVSLSSWLAIPPPKAPAVSVASAPITDRGSTFIAHAAPCTSPPSALSFQSFVRALRDSTHPTAADHEMMSWRTMQTKPGRDGLGGEYDWVVKYGSDDDGEKNGGNTIRKALEEGGAVDVVVVVSRYYGGVMLGPDRFSHMRTVTLQVLSLLSAAQLRTQLRTLDAEIDDLITSPYLFSPTAKLPLPPKYDQMKTDVLERLVKAREKRRDFLKGELEKNKVGEKGGDRSEDEVVIVQVATSGTGKGGKGHEAAEESEDPLT